MNTSDSSANSPEPVPNGGTWTITAEDFAKHAKDNGHDVHCVSDYPSDNRSDSNRPMSVIIAIDHESVRPAPGDGSGWVSVVIESRSGQWMNIAVYDPAPLIDAFSEALRLQSSRDEPDDLRGLLTSPVGTSGPTYVDLIRTALHGADASSLDSAIDALHDVVSVWELFFAVHPQLLHRQDEACAMVFYADDMMTFSFLETARYLPQESDSAELNLADLRIANALSRLRSLTGTVSPNYDIDKRCNGAIDAHVDRVPAASTLYRP